jgi:CheY-like chemotaxis protein
MQGIRSLDNNDSDSEDDNIEGITALQNFKPEVFPMDAGVCKVSYPRVLVVDDMKFNVDALNYLLN